MNSTNVHIVDNIKSALADFFSTAHYSSVFVLVDENTQAHCLSLIRDTLPEHWSVCISSGEKHKTIETCQKIWQSMTEATLDRKALFVNLGGGVIGDMGGFCAATYKRGIDFINIPTTLLAQVDASVGGKLGVDFFGFKNHIGLFQDPRAVLIDIAFLQTLPSRELRSGFAEIIKHALIMDSSYFQKIQQFSFESQPWKEHIAHSVAIKQEVVLADPTEKGLRKILNFGHTLGHAVETFHLGSENHLLHGEAIAVGMICEAYLSHKLLQMPEQELMEITDLLMEVYRCKKIAKEDFEAILTLMNQDKKNERGIVKMSLLSTIGKCKYDIGVSNADALDSLFYFNTIAK